MKTNAGKQTEMFGHFESECVGERRLRLDIGRRPSGRPKRRSMGVVMGDMRVDGEERVRRRQMSHCEVSSRKQLKDKGEVDS